MNIDAKPRSPASFTTVSRGRAALWVLALLLLLAGAGGAGGGGARHAAGSQEAAAGPGGRGGTGSPGGPGGNRRFGPGNRVQPVSVETVQRKDMRVTVGAIGTLTAANTAVVRAQVSGVLQALHFKEGQQVKAGQTLAQIDPRAFQAALAQVEGTLARDKAQLDNARIDLARYKDLVAKDAAARQTLDTQEATVRQLEGTVKADQGSVDAARLQLAYTQVHAPISGRVGLKQADLGNVVSSSDTNGIVTITQTRPIALVFSVPAAQLPQISAGLRAGKPLVAEAWERSGKQKLATGKVMTVDNAIDTSTDTIKLKALFPNEDEALFPNQSVSVRLQLDTLTAALAVPSAAVLRGAQGFYVYVVGEDSTVSTRVVKPGAVDGDWTAVDGPLQPGERVVIDGVDRLREGAKVEVIAADPAKRAGAQAAAGGRRGKGPGTAGAAASSASGASATGRH